MDAFTVAVDTEKINCENCRHLWLNCCGQAECVKNYEQICFKTNYVMWEEEIMNLKDIIHTSKDIKEMGHTIENNIIEWVDVNTIGHFGNTVTMEISCKNVYALCNYVNTNNIGFMIKAFIELFDLGEDNGVLLRDIKNIPCRLIFDGNGGWGAKCIGFGHFMKDKFVLNDEFVNIRE